MASCASLHHRHHEVAVANYMSLYSSSFGRWRSV